MRCWVGTSGFSYKAWKGSFYPEDLPNDGMLAYYGERLNAVEINNTFYRMPSRKMLTDWAGKVPDDFSFVLKATRKITHFKRLKDTQEELGYLVDVSSELGGRLGPMLFQLPPNLKSDVARLRDFVSLFPPGLRALRLTNRQPEFGQSSPRICCHRSGALSQRRRRRQLGNNKQRVGTRLYFAYQLGSQ